MNLRNKLFIVCFILLFFIIVFNINSVFAVTNENVVFTDIPEVVIKHVNENFVDTYPQSSYNYIFVSDGVNYQIHFIENSYKVYAVSLSQIKTNYNQKYIIIACNGEEILGVSDPYTSNSGIINFASSSSDNITSIPLYSTCHIYTDDSYTTTFFRQPPQGITLALVEETTKVQIMEQMKIMILGFLKYLIVLVVSLLAFWKGWKFLSTQLKKS